VLQFSLHPRPLNLHQSFSIISRGAIATKPVVEAASLQTQPILTVSLNKPLGEQGWRSMLCLLARWPLPPVPGDSVRRLLGGMDRMTAGKQDPEELMRDCSWEVPGGHRNLHLYRQRLWREGVYVLPLIPPPGATRVP
jgi:hypothetical protein